MQITEEMIKAKAYELWEANGRPEGSAEQNWFAAKALLQESDSQTTSTGNTPPPIGLRQLSSA
jgi:hypothetical protein